MASKKIALDKYYTPQELADYCVQKVIEIIGKENITELIESSAGNGVFLNSFEKLLPDVPYLAYDIEPEDNRIMKQDYLSLDLEYKKGRCVIGNPPFGKCNTLSVKFYKKSIIIGDYIAFILPTSQLNNNIQMYDFDLIYSENLGLVNFCNNNLHVCFNIYKMPNNKILNKNKRKKLKDICFIEYRRGGNNNIPANFDYVIGTFGGGCVGKVPNKIGHYSSELYFYIKNESLKSKILETVKNIDWKSCSKGVSNTYSLPQWKVIKILKEKIPELN